MIVERWRIWILNIFVVIWNYMMRLYYLRTKKKKKKNKVKRKIIFCWIFPFIARFLTSYIQNQRHLTFCRWDQLNIKCIFIYQFFLWRHFIFGRSHNILPRKLMRSYNFTYYYSNINFVIDLKSILYLNTILKSWLNIYIYIYIYILG